jgi:hypothetical protein
LAFARRELRREPVKSGNRLDAVSYEPITLLLPGPGRGPTKARIAPNPSVPATEEREQALLAHRNLNAQNV